MVPRAQEMKPTAGALCASKAILQYGALLTSPIAKRPELHAFTYLDSDVVRRRRFLPQ
jgi:hypothetical protein